ncbi:MAG: hypothetical protein QOJ83_3093, partial [Frankiales bacterium]|nr:hypothetical protein [Frankiales bacterium]
YGTSSGTRVSGHPSHIGQQWPILDMPSKPGPIAGVLFGATATWAVSASGHRWRIADDHGGDSTAVSPDGRLISYLVDNEGPLRIRDLVTGRVTNISGIGGNPGSSSQRFGLPGLSAPLGSFSADDRYLAFTAFDATQGGGGTSTVVVDVTRAAVIGATPEQRTIAGWSADRVVASAVDVQLESPTGQVVATTVLKPTEPLGPNSFGGSVGTTADGRQWVYLSGGESATTVTRFDLTSGVQIAKSAVLPAATESCGFAAGRTVTYTQLEGTAVVSVAPNGRAHKATTIDAGVNASCGVWAADAFDGKAHGALLLDRVSGWLIGWWLWLAWSCGGLLAVALVGWRAKGSRQRRNQKYPRFAGKPWSRRRKVVVVSSLMTPVIGILALLTPYVFIASTAHLTVTSAPLLWAPADQAATRLAGADGRPALTISHRLGQVQGYLVLVENHGGQDIHVLGPPDGDNPATENRGIGVAASEGTAAQARSLVYYPTGVIPAHQARWIRELGSHCIPGPAPKPSDGPGSGGYAYQSGLPVKVRVGWITRTESISFSPGIKWIAGGTC